MNVKIKANEESYKGYGDLKVRLIKFTNNLS